MTLLALTPPQVCACQAKRNGKTPAEAAPQLRFTACLVTPTAPMMTACLETLRGTRETMEQHQVHQPMEQSPLPAKPPMGLAFTTCQAMCGSGAMIGMAIIPQASRRTQQDLRQVCPACCAAATGTTAPATAARRPVSTAVPTTATTTSDSVSRGLRNSSLYPLLIPWNQLLFYFYPFTFTSLCQNCVSSFGKKSCLKLCARNRLVATK